MKAYFIFAIVLTALYVIYYAVIIVHDLYGKKGTVKSSEEEFDVNEFTAEEESISVVESDNGFNIGDNRYETEYVSETQNTPDAPSPAESNGSQQPSLLEKLKAKMDAELEETTATFSDAYNPIEMYKTMVAHGMGKPGVNLELKAKPVIDEL